MTDDVANDMTKDGVPGRVPAVHEEPAACPPGAAAVPASPASTTLPGVAEVSETTDAPTREDVRRFRLATLRARLALLGVAFDPSTDETTLRRMLRAAEGQGGGAAPTAPTGSTSPTGHASDPAPAAEPDLPPSAAMRRATARHLRERQRVAAADNGVGGVTGSPRTGGRSRGRGRS